MGLTYEEKEAALEFIISERNNQIEMGLQPESHEPTYNKRRFGLA